MSPPPNWSDMSLPEIVDRLPEATAVFERYGIRLEGYKALEHETLQATAKVHQLDLSEVLTELELLSSGSSSNS
ncbi:MAG: hypothetical protein SFZ03_08285 [Candidatus Melainabacteria bacterium]|nr:hypothetical protein [Candidatus Melainabacteria bacterium]